MTRRKLVWVAVATVAVLAAEPLAARKFPPLGVRCDDDFPKLRVDASGLKDMCLATTAPSCSGEQMLRFDAEGEADDCATMVEGGEPASEGSPKCPKGYTLRSAEGEDACEKIRAPTCRKRYKLKVKKGDDQCLRK